LKGKSKKTMLVRLKRNQ